MTTPASAPPVRRREIFGWAMFDFANSSYTTIVVTVAFGDYFTQLVAPGGAGDRLWGIGIAVSNGLVMLLSVAVGAVADGAARKKAFLFASYLACVAGTAGLWFATPGRVALALTLFVVSNIAFSLGENFTSSFLPELSTPQNIGRISGFGWGLGYVGAYFVQAQNQFWVIAVVAGLGIGSLQSAARSMVGLFAPVEKSGEFFGLWGLAGKAAYAVGPLVFGWVSSETGSQRAAILSTAAFFVLGLVAMAFVDVAAGRRAADAWDRRERLSDLGAHGSDTGAASP